MTVTDRDAKIKLYLGEIAVECISLGQRKDETIVEFIRRLASDAPTAGQVEAALSVYRERKAMEEERDRHRIRTVDDRSDWPKDGFINDCD